MKKIIYIGPLGGNNKKNLNNGASIKNYYVIKRLQELNLDILTIDTQKWKQNPLIFFKLIYTIISHRESNFIISTSFKSAYYLLSLLPWFISKNNIFYWVIGGALAEKIKVHKFKTKRYSGINKIIVEGEQMKKDLNGLNILNSIVLSNFKYIPSLPLIPQNISNKINFVFLSRIIPEKGCNLIFEACKYLNSKSLTSQYSVSFYGPIDSKYQDEFNSRVDQFDNIEYKGFLDLELDSSYNILASYDFFLFPTFWPTEGFPGVFIDAYISGLPIIASDWNLNNSLIDAGETGYIIPPKNSKELAICMQNIIENKNAHNCMREKCQYKAKAYSIETVISIENLRKIGLI